jgi:hypothetical protein
MKYWAFISYSHMDKKWGDWLLFSDTFHPSTESETERPLIV